MRGPSAESLFAAALCLFSVSITSSAIAKTYALVVGIDDYQHIGKLAGAVNDANDIAETLAQLPDTEVVKLLDHDATKQRFLDQWAAFRQRSVPGDTIIITYAGHGGYEPAAADDDEEDGRDETIMFAGFSPQGEAAAERLRDNDLAVLLQESEAMDVNTIVVFDSCHSGTAIRSASFEMASRYHEIGPIDDDPLPPPPPVVASSSADQRTFFFAAVRDHEKAIELALDGQIRGALSHAFARGIDGAADHDGDGVIQKGELEEHIRRSVSMLTDGKQHPQVSPFGAVDRPLLALVEPEPDPKLDLLATPFDALPEVAVWIEGPSPQDFLSRLDGVIAVDSPELAEIILDLPKRVIHSSVGDPLAEMPRRLPSQVRNLQHLVDRHRLIRALQGLSVDGTMEIGLSRGNILYQAGDEVAIRVRGRQHDYATLFNLPSDGRVEWLYPRAPALIDRHLNHPYALDRSRDVTMHAVVSPPFGADYLVAIETEDDVPEVRIALRELHDFEAISDLWEVLRLILRDTDYHVHIHPFFTSPG